MTPPPTPENPLIIDILVYPGADELDIIAPLEVLRSAELAGAPMRVRLVRVGSSDPVVLTHGIELKPWQVLVPGEAHVVVVPGGGWAARAPVGTWAEYQTGEIPGVLRSIAAMRKDTIFASVCTGAMLLAAAGIINASTKATTHHAAWADLEAATGVPVVKQRFVDDGNVLSAGGVTSGLDLSLHIIERFIGKEMSIKCSKRVEYPADVIGYV
ncbi:hypothetical protein HK105_203596 [Polyrhizophydium stewartii]|uniref:DJ-1/PfpI domain-containing protein n=1 Tax=Polyrhizophydium stewartii TaxID=2732419 RepID=A0ABR4NBF3_9FUNG|nr:hypothetical protein HK105_008303 [Polyrhizophydium stewartii]